MSNLLCKSIFQFDITDSNNIVKTKKTNMKSLVFLFKSISTVVCVLIINTAVFGQGVVITEETSSVTPHESSIFDVRSINKGFLIPRMTSTERVAIPNPANGLLVYDLTENQFFYYNSSTTSWVKAVGPQGPQGIQGPQGLLEPGTAVGNTPYWNGSQWVLNSSNIYNDGTNVGIGTTPSQKLDVNGAIRLRGHLFDRGNTSGVNGQVLTRTTSGVIWQNPAGNVSGTGTIGRLAYWSSAANIAALPLMNYNTTSQFVEVTSKAVANDDDPIFEVRNKDGLVVLGVYQTGVRVYVDDDDKKTGRGGFAVGGFTTQKEKSNIEYLRVTPDSVRVYIDADAKKTGRGGFAVGGYTTQKAGITDNFFNIETASAEIIPLPGEPRILWYPLKEAFMAGRVIVQHPDSVGTNSWASGFQSMSKGNFSQALGHQAIARRQYSTAIGKSAVASGESSYAFGSNAIAGSSTKGNSYAIGAGSKALGSGSYAIGSEGIDTLAFLPTGVYTSATGDYSFAIGLGANSSHVGSLSLGVSATATANYANAIGNFSKAEGNYATAIGNRSTATGTNSIALNGATAEGFFAFAAGEHSKASGNHSVAIGQGYPYLYGSTVFNSASGVGAFALGYANSAAGNHSFAIGYSNYVNGAQAIAIGANAYAQSLRSVAVGQYHLAIGSTNSWVATDPLFVVGNGAHNEARNNAFSVLKNGNVGIGPATPTAKLHVDGSVRLQNLSSSTQTRIMVMDTNGNVSFRDAGSWAGGTTNVTGSGTNNYLSKWSGTYTQTNSIIFDNGTNVGIGTNAPGSYKLYVTHNGTGTDGATIYTRNTATAGISLMVENTSYSSSDCAAIIVNRGTGNLLNLDSYGGSSTGWNRPFVFTNNGRLGIGNTSPAYQLQLSQNSAAKPTSSAWTVPSDLRLKDIKGDYEKGLSEILLLETVVYRYKADNPMGIKETNTDAVGFVAQDVQKVFPEAVQSNEKGYLDFDIHPILVAQVNAIKELNEKIEMQNKVIEELVNRIKAIENSKD